MEVDVQKIVELQNELFVAISSAVRAATELKEVMPHRDALDDDVRVEVLMMEDTTDGREQILRDVMDDIINKLYGGNIA